MSLDYPELQEIYCFKQ